MNVTSHREQARERLLRYRLVIFDADGTLRRTLVDAQPCPYRAGEWELLPGVDRLLRAIPWNNGGPALALASNQDHVGYGHLTESAARGLLRDLARDAAGVSLPDEALRLCPHVLGVDCACRKPAPGMLLDAMRWYGVPPHETLFVGDSASDAAAARAAGIDFLSARELFTAIGH